MLDMVKDYDRDIIYHQGTINMVSDALSHKAVGTSDRGLYLMMNINSPLLDLIREDHPEEIRRVNWKKERIRGQISMFVTNS